VNLFGIGPGELLLILILALIVFGPRRLPEIGRNLGQMMRELREASEEITDQFRQEMEATSDELQAASEALTGKTEKRPPPNAAPPDLQG
jgi:sec-independent protein translocase protein TatA